MKKLIVLSILFFKLFPICAQPPSLAWANQVGGNAQVSGGRITVDHDGNVYAIGVFDGTADFDPGPGVYNLTAKYYDIFISKTDAFGNFIWVKQFGGSGYDSGNSIELDSYGNIYAIGSFQYTTDFDPGPGILNVISAGKQDIFILKLTSSGNFIWVKQFGNNLDDLGSCLSLDNNNCIYASGIFTGKVDFDPGTDSSFITGGYFGDIFILKLDVFGNFVWAKSFIANSNNTICSIFLDKKGFIYCSGGLQGTTDFDPGPNSFNLTTAGYNDIFITKLDNFGDFIWAEKFGNSRDDFGGTIKVDLEENIYCLGSYQGTVDFDPGQGTFNLTSTKNNVADYFVLKLNRYGNLIWAKTIGGITIGALGCLAFDFDFNIYVTGGFGGISDFDPGVGVHYLAPNGDFDIFILKLDSSGSFVYVKQMGGPLQEAGSSIVLDESGSIYTSGYFQGRVDFDPNGGVFNLSSIGSVDFFLNKMSKFESGINKSDMTHGLKIYPIPTSSIVYLQLPIPNENYQLEIYNNIGALIEEGLIVNGNNITIDLISQPCGLYVVKVINKENKTTVGHIIKTNN